MNQETYIPFAEIVSELRKVCAENKTGIMYITSGANRSAQLMIDQGEIVYLYCFNKRGRDALRLMSEIEAGRFRFQDGSSSSHRADLPHTEDILRYLSAAVGLDPVEQDGGPTDLSSGGEGSPRSIVTLTVDQKRILEEGLAVYIGPMAAIICEDHLGSASDIEVAVELLAAEIPTSAQADAFRVTMIKTFVG